MSLHTLSTSQLEKVVGAPAAFEREGEGGHLDVQQLQQLGLLAVELLALEVGGVHGVLLPADHLVVPEQRRLQAKGNRHLNSQGWSALREALSLAAVCQALRRVLFAFGAPFRPVIGNHHLPRAGLESHSLREAFASPSVEQGIGW